MQVTEEVEVTQDASSLHTQQLRQVGVLAVRRHLHPRSSRSHFRKSAVCFCTGCPVSTTRAILVESARICSVQGFLEARLQDAERVVRAQAELAQKWEALLAIKTPQELQAAIEAQQRDSELSQQQTNLLAADIWEALKERDDEYVSLLHSEALRTDRLMQLLAKQAADLQNTCSEQLRIAANALSEVCWDCSDWTSLLRLWRLQCFNVCKQERPKVEGMTVERLDRQFRGPASKQAPEPAGQVVLLRPEATAEG